MSLRVVPEPDDGIEQTSNPYACIVDSYPELVRRALERDEDAWRTLVDSVARVAWRTLNCFDLSHQDREDAFASTFFQLYKHLARIEEPRKLPGWVAATARNEARALCRKLQRQVPMGELPLHDFDGEGIDEMLLDDELTRETLEAFARLSPSDQAILRLVTAVPPLAHREIAALLDIPLGSVGPKCLRAKARLRAAMRAYENGGAS